MDKRYLVVDFFLDESGELIEESDSFAEASRVADEYFFDFFNAGCDVCILDRETRKAYGPGIYWREVGTCTIAEEPSDVLH